MPTAVINPIADAYISQSNPNANFGLSDFLFTGKLAGPDNIYRSLLKFNISGAIPAGSTITNVSLNLFVFRKDTPDAV
ncbi:DNRLRE domain-containing protein, partial [Clostridium sp. Maddingley MBC34-26]|uniref:DNRLRE domain-containing protein n=1 Tax=Clostridium sp. Maddingley MBC34-26 TaxID=1196322 RepID=UPI0002972934